MIDLATQLAPVLAQGREASREAEELGRKLDVSTVLIRQWPSTAHKVISVRIGSGGGFLPGEQESAERRLTGRQLWPRQWTAHRALDDEALAEARKQPRREASASQ